MTTIITHLKHLNHSVQHIILWLRRRRTIVETKITLALPPFIKIELGLKSEPPHAANDSQPRRNPSGAA